jgi:hypothetical protein
MSFIVAYGEDINVEDELHRKVLDWHSSEVSSEVDMCIESFLAWLEVGDPENDENRQEWNDVTDRLLAEEIPLELIVYQTDQGRDHVFLAHTDKIAEYAYPGIDTFDKQWLEVSDQEKASVKEALERYPILGDLANPTWAVIITDTEYQ